MSGFSPEDAMAMERRHIQEGEQRIIRQETRVVELNEKGNSEITLRAVSLLKFMHESLEFSRERLRDLERRYHNTPKAESD
jgi:hypothetical protein